MSDSLNTSGVGTSPDRKCSGSIKLAPDPIPLGYRKVRIKQLGTEYHPDSSPCLKTGASSGFFR